MSRTCTYQWGGTSGGAEWSFDDGTLLLMPVEGPPEAFALKECSGISGDGYALSLRFGREVLGLLRLGQDGPTLLERLRRVWPALRAEGLRLSGSGAPVRFTGALATSGASPAPCEALLFEDCLLAALDGEDLRPIFLALTSHAAFDEAAYAVTLKDWAGAEASFTKLAGRTTEFLDKVKAARSLLTREAAGLHAKHLPTLGAQARAVLSATWLPGRMMSGAELEKACPGFIRAFEASWLGQSLRKREGEALLAWAGAGGSWFGFGRPGVGLESGAEEEAPPQAGGEGAGEGDASAPPAEPPDCLLWLLCRKGSAWLLETLAEQGHATYRFEGGDEMPGLVSRLLCASQFSREALYLPVESLTGDRAGLAIAARELPFLVDLRSRFRGRVIHSGFAAWRAKAVL